MQHDWNCAKLERLAPALDQALARKVWPRELADDEVPVVEPYGSASFIPARHDKVLPAGINDATKGALGVI